MPFQFLCTSRSQLSCKSKLIRQLIAVSGKCLENLADLSCGMVHVEHGSERSELAFSGIWCSKVSPIIAFSHSKAFIILVRLCRLGQSCVLPILCSFNAPSLP